MTIQEVLSIKEEKSKETMNMPLPELKAYYAKRLINFNSIMDKLIVAKPNSSENYIYAEDKINIL